MSQSDAETRLRSIAEKSRLVTETNLEEELDALPRATTADLEARGSSIQCSGIKLVDRGSGRSHRNERGSCAAKVLLGNAG